MTSYSQRARSITISTPLGDDVLLLEALSGSEAISELFEFRLELLAAAKTVIPFDQILGKGVTIALECREAGTRYLTGMVNQFSQGAELRGPDGDRTFVRYQATVVPPLWLLTRRVQSRIFQHVTVPEILKTVLAGLTVNWRLAGKYEPRDYCVQYHETDFAFASRLMEEEGIFYFFEHGNGSHTLVLADHPQGHTPVPVATTLIYDVVEGGNRPEDRITGWTKTQEVRSGKHTLWDHCFEFPGDSLEARAVTMPEVRVGEVTHPLAVAGNDKLEVYEFPGGYARRFDGVDPGGADRPDDVEKIFSDNRRTARIRMEQEAVLGIRITGQSTCRQLTAGHKFTLDRHFNADGDYIITRVQHRASIRSEYNSTAAASEELYENTFQAIPAELPFRPQRVTARGRVWGTQTATVVGPSGEEIFTDKYGRIKVQFHWDRQGKFDADSSCWVRVSQVHAGRSWGGIDIPRVGEEVVVAFEEGDPDQPIVIGRVYNAGAMPPFGLPKKRMISGLKSNTYPGGKGDNEISMDDSKGSERMYIHAQYNQDEVVDNNQTSHVKNSRTKTIDVDETTTIGNNRTENVAVNHTETIGVDRMLTIGGNQTHAITGNADRTIGGSKSEAVGMMANETVALAKTISVGGAMAITVGAAMNTAVGGASFEEVGLIKKIIVGTSLEIVCGASKITMDAGGKITIVGTDILIDAGGGTVDVNGGIIDLN